MNSSLVLVETGLCLFFSSSINQKLNSDEIGLAYSQGNWVITSPVIESQLLYIN